MKAMLVYNSLFLHSRFVDGPKQTNQQASYWDLHRLELLIIDCKHRGSISCSMDQVVLFHLLASLGIETLPLHHPLGVQELVYGRLLCNQITWNIASYSNNSSIGNTQRRYEKLILAW